MSQFSQQKPHKISTIITPIPVAPSSNDSCNPHPNMIFGLMFSQPSDLLILYREHMYCLFSLLYYYGEQEHKDLTIHKIKKCSAIINSYLDRQNEGQPIQKIQKIQSSCQVTSLNVQNSSQIRNMKSKLNSLRFLCRELQKNLHLQDNKVNLHSFKEREYLRKAYITIFENESGFTFKADMSFVELTKWLSHLVGIDLQIRNYYEIQIIELKCPQFQLKNLQVYVEINKQFKTYRYLKQIHRPPLIESLTIHKLDIQDRMELMGQIYKKFSQNSQNPSFMNLIRVETSLQIDEQQLEDQLRDECGHDEISLNEKTIMSGRDQATSKMLEGGSQFQFKQEDDQLLEESLVMVRNLSDEGSKPYKIEQNPYISKSKKEQEQNQSVLQQSQILVKDKDSYSPNFSLDPAYVWPEEGEFEKRYEYNLRDQLSLKGDHSNKDRTRTEASLISRQNNEGDQERRKRANSVSSLARQDKEKYDFTQNHDYKNQSAHLLASREGTRDPETISNRQSAEYVNPFMTPDDGADKMQEDPQGNDELVISLHQQGAGIEQTPFLGNESMISFIGEFLEGKDSKEYEDFMDDLLAIKKQTVSKFIKSQMNLAEFLNAVNIREADQIEQNYEEYSEQCSHNQVTTSHNECNILSHSKYPFKQNQEHKQREQELLFHQQKPNDFIFQVMKGVLQREKYSTIANFLTKAQKKYQQKVNQHKDNSKYYESQNGALNNYTNPKDCNRQPKTQKSQQMKRKIKLQGEKIRGKKIQTEPAQQNNDRQQNDQKTPKSALAPNLKGRGNTMIKNFQKKRGSQIVKFPKTVTSTEGTKGKQTINNILVEKGGSIKQIIEQAVGILSPPFRPEDIYSSARIGYSSSCRLPPPVLPFSMHRIVNQELQHSQRHEQIQHQNQLSKSKLLKISEAYCQPNLISQPKRNAR